MASASSLPLVMTCIGSEVFPTVKKLNPWGERGTVLHRYLAVAIPHGVEAGIKEVPDQYQDECRQIQLDQIKEMIGTDTPTFELALAYDVISEKARMIGTGLNRDYGILADTEIPGTIDISIHRAIPVVGDFKTGWLKVEAEGNWQFQFLAVAYARLHGLNQIDCAVLQLNDAGEFVPRIIRATSLELDQWADDLREFWKARALAKHAFGSGHLPVLTEGDHCKRCESFAFCPAKNAMVRSMREGTPDKLFGAPAVETLPAKDLGEVWAALNQYQEVIERIQAAIKERAHLEPIPLPSGKTLTKTESEYLIPEVAYTTLANTYGPEVATQASSLKCSKESIKKALGSKSEAAFKAIRKANGMTVREAVKEVAGKKLLKAV